MITMLVGVATASAFSISPSSFSGSAPYSVSIACNLGQVGTIIFDPGRNGGSGDLMFYPDTSSAHITVTYSAPGTYAPVCYAVTGYGADSQTWYTNPVTITVTSESGSSGGTATPSQMTRWAATTAGKIASSCRSWGSSSSQDTFISLVGAATNTAQLDVQGLAACYADPTDYPSNCRASVTQSQVQTAYNMVATAMKSYYGSSYGTVLEPYSTDLSTSSGRASAMETVCLRYVLSGTGQGWSGSIIPSTTGSSGSSGSSGTSGSGSSVNYHSLTLKTTTSQGAPVSATYTVSYLGKAISTGTTPDTILLEADKGYDVLATAPNGQSAGTYVYLGSDETKTIQLPYSGTMT